MKNDLKNVNTPVIVILYLLAALFLGYGIYMAYDAVVYVQTYDTNDAVSSSNMMQYVVAASASYFGFAIVIFAAASIMTGFNKIQRNLYNALLIMEPAEYGYDNFASDDAGYDNNINEMKDMTDPSAAPEPPGAPKTPEVQLQVSTDMNTDDKSEAAEAPDSAPAPEVAEAPASAPASEAAEAIASAPAPEAAEELGAIKESDVNDEPKSIGAPEAAEASENEEASGSVEMQTPVEVQESVPPVEAAHGLPRQEVSVHPDLPETIDAAPFPPSEDLTAQFLSGTRTTAPLSHNIPSGTSVRPQTQPAQTAQRSYAAQMMQTAQMTQVPQTKPQTQHQTSVQTKPASEHTPIPEEILQTKRKRGLKYETVAMESKPPTHPAPQDLTQTIRLRKEDRDTLSSAFVRDIFENKE